MYLFDFSRRQQNRYRFTASRPCSEDTRGAIPVTHQPHANYRAGLTLLELIVALGILAVLATIAVQSLDPIADQARYEATQRLLDDLRTATAGDRSARQTGGQRIISGFIADTGSLPTALDDLLNLPAGMIASSSQSFDSDRDTVDDVTLISGWDGPYFQFPAGHTEIIDSWGNPLQIGLDGSDFLFTSLGSDNDSDPPETGYRADVSVTIPESEYTSSVTCRLFEIDPDSGLRVDPSPTGSEQLGVLFYAVNAAGGTSGAIEELLVPVASTGTFEAIRNNLIHGQAAARGILWEDDNANEAIDAGEAIVKLSYVHYFTVTGRSDLRVEMDLR